MTFRAIRTLKEVSLIAAEDTRHTSKLLSYYQITTPVISCHEHNEELRINIIVDKLSQGFDVALVSDAGTPLISDPGYRVVKGVVEAGFQVIPIPGACAAIAGLSVSALPTDSFIFSGFLNKKQARRKSELEALKITKSTIIFYESPHRLVALIEDILSVMGDRPAMVAREITKYYEEYLRGRLSYILESLKSRVSIKGECALFVGSHSDTNNEIFSIESSDIDDLIITALKSSEIKSSKLAKSISQKYNLPRSEVYERILDLQSKNL
ncbi:MAG: 16S rRNA (cytidine(1402)-2'-O)-methyltransferase [Desulfamplus sp.]|nr:16S rRNA (cytidine(1402)-2'-O)-methyltransferase [Desulfamplus sp.]